uniref:Tail collar domain protein n=1 Tax=viral metagenome TaxID=1070528 RepID=A0A6C0KQG0_9ZZZZ
MKEKIVYTAICLVFLGLVAICIWLCQEHYTYSGNSSGQGTVENTRTLTMDDTGNLSLVYSVPVGTIVAWSGNSTTIPKGWALCDGTTTYTDINGNTQTVPNLSGSFLLGANGDTGAGPSTQVTPGDAGGQWEPNILTQGAFSVEWSPILFPGNDENQVSISYNQPESSYVSGKYTTIPPPPYVGVNWIIKIA